MSVDIENQLKSLTIVQDNNLTTTNKKSSDMIFLLHYCKENMIYGFLYSGWIIITIWNIHSLALENDKYTSIWYYLLCNTCINSIALNTYIIYYYKQIKWSLYISCSMAFMSFLIQVWGVTELLNKWKLENIYVMSVTNISISFFYYGVIVVIFNEFSIF